MSFINEELAEQRLETYKQLKRDASNIVSRVNAWESQFAALRAEVTPDKQAELDARKTTFINALRAALSI